MIPHTIHFFWSGEKLTFMRYLTLYSFRRHNPDFHVILHSPSALCCNKTWTTPELDDSNYSGLDYLPMIDELNIERRIWKSPFKNLSHSQASDLFEWDILCSEGGLYADMDILWIRPINSIFSRADTHAIFCLERQGRVFAIGFTGSSPECPIIRSIRGNAFMNYSPRQYESAGAIAVYKAAQVSPKEYNHNARKAINYFKGRFPTTNITVLPDEFLYYFNCQSYPDIFNTSLALPEISAGIHWFGGAPISQQWNNLLTKDNFRNYDNTFTRYAKMIYE